MNINITPQEDQIKGLYDILTTEIVVPGSPDEELIKELINKSIQEYLQYKERITDISDAKVYCLFSIIKQMRIIDGSWDESIEIE